MSIPLYLSSLQADAGLSYPGIRRCYLILLKPGENEKRDFKGGLDLSGPLC
jgi:hypothetical protein